MADEDAITDVPEEAASTYDELFAQAVSEQEGPDETAPETPDEPEADEEQEAVEEAPAKEDEDQAVEEKSETPEEIDIWANAAPELIAERDKLINDKKAMQGRLSAADRRINEMQKAAEKKPATPEERLDKLEKDREQDHQKAEFKSLEARFPGWSDYLNTNKDAYEAWIKTQPRDMQALDASLNTRFSADDAAVLLEPFRAHMDAQKPKATPAPAPDPKEEPAPKAVEPPKPDPEITAHQRRRERQLNASADPNVRAPRAQSGIPDEFEAAFNEFSKEFNS